MATYPSEIYRNQFAQYYGISVETRTPAHQLAGTMRALYWDVLTATSSTATYGSTLDIDNGDLLIVGMLKKGTRLLTGYAAWGAMGSSATLIIGLYAYDSDLTDGLGTVVDADLLLASEDVSSAGKSTICTNDVAPEELGYLTTADVLVVATAGGADYADAKHLKIYVPYIND